MTVATITKTEPLTAADVKALRTADSVAFRISNGVATIEPAIRTLNEPAVYTASQQRLFPEVSAWDRQRTITVGGYISFYDEVTRKTAGPEGSAFELIQASRFSQTWKTISGLLKVGDVLTLNFYGDRYANGYSRKTDLHVDSLHLDVNRGKRGFTFVVAVGVTPANSARMVKPEGF